MKGSSFKLFSFGVAIVLVTSIYPCRSYGGGFADKIIDAGQGVANVNLAATLATGTVLAVNHGYRSYTGSSFLDPSTEDLAIRYLRGSTAFLFTALSMMMGGLYTVQNQHQHIGPPKIGAVVYTKSGEKVHVQPLDERNVNDRTFPSEQPTSDGPQPDYAVATGAK